MLGGWSSWTSLELISNPRPSPSRRPTHKRVPSPNLNNAFTRTDLNGKMKGERQVFLARKTTCISGSKLQLA